MTKIIHLTQGKSAIVDDEDYEWASKIKWRLVKGGYAGRSSTKNYKTTPITYLHRVIAGTPIGMETDHINGDRLDNRRANLRIATHAQNGANRRSLKRGSTSKYKGAYLREWGKWVSSIKVNQKIIGLGCFENELDAAIAYDNAARKYFGEFAVLNFPERKPEDAQGGSGS